MMRVVHVLIAVWSAGVTIANAATITASSCSAAAVQTAINAAATGDTVVIPNGSCTWTSGVNISGKGLILKGQTPGGVTIANNVTSRAAISITEHSTHHVDVSQLTIVGNSSEYSAIAVTYNGTNGKAVLIHHIAFTDSRAIRMHTNRGVIYSNTVNQRNNRNLGFVQCTPAGFVPGSWTTASTMGMADKAGQSNVYVEDNVIAYATAQSIDIAGDCRIVVRRNTFDHSALSSHGADTEPAGLRHFELYDNTFMWVDRGDCNGSQTVNLDYFFFLRGGTGVIANNAGLVDMDSCAWGHKSAVNVTVMNLRRKAGPNPCWGAGTSGGAQYPAPRQIGLGRVTGNGIDGLGRATDSHGYVGDREPLYIWDQPGLALSERDYSPNECGGSTVSSDDYIVQGRDYFVGTPKPGYSRFSYPHPLRSGVSGPIAPGAPQNLRITH